MGDKMDKAKKAAAAAKKGLNVVKVATGMKCRFCDAPMQGCKQCPKCGRITL